MLDALLVIKLFLYTKYCDMPLMQFHSAAGARLVLWGEPVVLKNNAT